MLLKVLIVYFVLISFISIIITIYDKLAAVHNKRRIRESTLFLISTLGGSLLMYITMLFVRHKTKHLNFMIGIPVIILVQLALIITVLVSI